MRIGMIILCLFGFIGVNGQRYGDINLFEQYKQGYNFKDFKRLFPGNAGDYYYIQNNSDTCYLNGVVQGYNNNYIPFSSLNYDIIYKFDKFNKVVNKVLIDAERVDSKIIFLNNRVICFGSYTGDLFINNEKILDSPDPINNIKRSSFIVIFDEDLNLEKEFKIENHIDIIESVAYHDGKYYIAGSFQWLEITLEGYTLKQNYRTEATNYDTEIFLFVMDAVTYEVLDGSSFGGEARESVNQLEVDSEGNIWIMGKANGQEFTIDNQNFPTSGLYVANDLFLLKLDKNLNYLWFKQFGINADSDNNFILDKNQNVYFSGFSEDYLKINYQIHYESLGNYFQYFICFDTNGEIIWIKTNAENNPNPGALGYLKYYFSKDDDIIVACNLTSYSDLYYDGIKLKESLEKTYIPTYLVLNKLNGELKDFGVVFQGWSTILDNLIPLENGNYYLQVINQRVPDEFAKVDTSFWGIKPWSSFAFEFNPTIPDIVSTLDEETTNSFTEINIFPNPIQKQSKLSIQANESIRTIEMYDINGRLIERISAVDETMTINSNQLPGTYILKFQKESQGSVYKKLIIQ